jgi:hypothetical protein
MAFGQGLRIDKYCPRRSLAVSPLTISGLLSGLPSSASAFLLLNRSATPTSPFNEMKIETLPGGVHSKRLGSFNGGLEERGFIFGH